MNIKELRTILIDKGVNTHTEGTPVYEMLFGEDDPEFLQATCINEPGDIEEIASMTAAEVIAFCGLAVAMNFLENNSDGEDWIGPQYSWYVVNSYWIEKYPIAYRCLEVWVWS